MKLLNPNKPSKSSMDIFGEGSISVNRYFISKHGGLPMMVGVQLGKNNPLPTVEKKLSEIFGKLDKIHDSRIYQKDGAYSIDDVWYEADDGELLITMGSQSFLEVEMLKFTFKNKKYFKIIEDKVKHLHPDDKLHKINLVCKDMGFYLEEFSIEGLFQSVDLELNYGKKFLEVDRKITDSIKSTNKGLILLHGVPGSGKTTYIKNLLGRVGSKKIIYAPPFIADFITSPEFLPFIMQQKNSLLVIEDAESILLSRDTANQNSAVANILNVSDGILADCLNLQIICTFNTAMGKIDSALTRKGRMIAEHKFGELSEEESQRVADSINCGVKVTKPMTLADIYNLKDDNFKKEEDNRIVGFGS